MIETYLGRVSSVSSEKIVQLAEATTQGELYSGVANQQGHWVCNFCGTKDEVVRGPCTCSDHCFYCKKCLSMGKVKICTKLLFLPDKNEASSLAKVAVCYRGALSKEQAMISQQLVEFVTNKSNEQAIVWAVTGSGKTEMIFAVIKSVLEKGGRVGIAAPRIDVCLELAPRLQVAFPTVEQLCLNSLVHEDYRRVPLTIATTHQLLRFYQAFDLLIIDEVDAFPYSDEPMLAFGAKRSLKKQGNLLYLTATPSKAMQQKIQKKELTSFILPARYHRKPLTIPQMQWCGDWDKWIGKHRLPYRLRRWIQGHLDSEKKFLLFVATIKMIPDVMVTMKKYFPQAIFTSVSSIEPERKLRIEQMRKNTLDFLITTTILERGVTFENIDVLVLGSDAEIFTKEVLVQIAGRVGRSHNYPTGEVVFMHYGQTKAMKAAVKEIKALNKRAKQEGMLDD